MKVLITGGTGFIGRHLIKSLIADQHEVAVLSRREIKSKNRFISYLQWDGESMPFGIGLYDVVINLAGAGIADSRWTEAHKKAILESRRKGTRACVDYINNSPNPPKLFISASAVGYYGVEREGSLAEDTPAGSDFAAEVGVIWEEEAMKANCRTVIPRIGIVLGEDGGFMEKVVPIYKLYVGGKFASGKQGFPWIHIDDIVGSLRFFMENEATEGPYNLAGPQQMSQGEFSKELSKALGVWDIFTVPKFALDLVFGEQSLLFWGGQFISSDKLQEAGYQFKFPRAESALKDLV